MASSVLPEFKRKVFTHQALRTTAKQSQGILLIPIRLRRAIKKYIRERHNSFMRRNVLRLSESFNGLKGANVLLSSPVSRELVENPARDGELHSRRWKIQSEYGDIGFKYGDYETVAYIASRMPAVFSACHRVLREVRRRLPEFSPARVLDFGAGPGTAFWAVRQVWPHSLEQMNLIEPSQDMQRAGQGLLQGLKSLPFIQSFDSLQSLSKKLGKLSRKHDLVISSYALGEIPTVSDRITIVRQLWDFTKDVLVLVEPGTPQGFKIISQMRSHILWMEKRKCRKVNAKASGTSSDSVNATENKSNEKCGAFVVAPCPHDGCCPLENTTKYCHFVQRLERTSVQRAYKQSKGGPLRGFEDEKFCFVVLRRGTRPREAWPLDGMKFETLKEQKEAMRKIEDHMVDEVSEDLIETKSGKHIMMEDEDDLVPYASDVSEADDTDNDLEDFRKGDDVGHANLGGGWGRIVHSPVRRGRLVEINVCRCTKRDCSAGSFDRVVLTKTSNPSLHLQARKSLWGDLWPCESQVE